MDLPKSSPPNELKGARRAHELLQGAATVQEKASLLAATHPFSSRWLEALPSANVGTLLPSTHFRACVALRVGEPISQAHECSRCHSAADALGVHGLACKRSAGRRPRHALFNQVIARGFAEARVPTRLEPSHLTLADGKRPDGLTLIPWALGKSVVRDASTCSTLCASNVEATGRRAGAAAQKSAQAKMRKYQQFSREFQVVPLIFETHGPLNESAREFLKSLCKRMNEETGDPRAGLFFQQRLSLAVQRGNAISVLGSMMPPEEEDLTF